MLVRKKCHNFLLSAEHNTIQSAIVVRILSVHFVLSWNFVFSSFLRLKEVLTLQVLTDAEHHDLTAVNGSS